MRILVTRPAADGEALARRLAGLGHEAVPAPMLEIAARPFAAPDWRRFGGLVFTSRNAVAMAGPFPPGALGLTVFAVGAATGKAARAAGFSTVVSADGDASDLAALLAARVEPGGPPLLHLSGEETRADLAAILAPRGIAIERLVVYAVRPAESLSEAARAALRDGAGEGGAGGVLLLSPKTARAFADAVRAAGLAPLPERFLVLAISEAAAAGAAGLGGRVRVAPRPDLDALLALLPPGEE